MTITLPDPTTTAADWALAEAVSHHMQTHFPDTTPAASWTTARDERDNTAVVVAFPGSDPTLPGGCYATHLYRWLCSLRDAGFTVEARTDMEVFGRPDEQSPSGRARWIHVTAWAQPEESPEDRSFKIPGPRKHFVNITPGSVPNLYCAGSRSTATVWGFRFAWAESGLRVTVDFEHSAWLMWDEIPDWVLAIAREHESCVVDDRCQHPISRTSAA
ncbi:hypothetical protein ABZV65_19500 [Streptomyces bauhiniae]|uniref:hypothetical protein n=1 Tax=Streptomyces bauhiniae TaxID=2340725 RepID=UPI0033AA92F6